MICKARLRIFLSHVYVTRGSLPTGGGNAVAPSAAAADKATGTSTYCPAYAYVIFQARLRDLQGTSTYSLSHVYVTRGSSQQVAAMLSLPLLRPLIRRLVRTRMRIFFQNSSTSLMHPFRS